MLNFDEIIYFPFLAGVYTSSHLVRGGNAEIADRLSVCQSQGTRTIHPHTLTGGGKLESQSNLMGVFGLQEETLRKHSNSEHESTLKLV